MIAAVRLFLARLNPQFLKLLGFVLACVFGGCVLTQCGTYGLAVLRRFGLGREQAKAEASHAQRAARTVARTTAYSIDSAVAATERRDRLRTDSILAIQQHALLSTRPARLVLPADPPRERAGD